MSTLLLQLYAMSQAYGTESHFNIRRTGREPSKSAVIGMLANALGWSRDADLSSLCSLKFGVRVDQEGVIEHDFQMVTNPSNASRSYATHREYLDDALFLAGLESDNVEFLQMLCDALKHPERTVYLGRSSCLPSAPLVMGIRNTDLETSLREEEWLASDWMKKRWIRERKSEHEQTDTVCLRMVLDANPGEETAIVKDLPLSFAHGCRQYGYRPVTEKFVEKAVKEPSKSYVKDLHKHCLNTEAGKHSINSVYDTSVENDIEEEIPIRKPNVQEDSQMYIITVKMNMKKGASKIALQQPSKIHGAIETAFGGERNRKLWRIDRANSTDDYILTIVCSELPPDLTDVVRQFGYEEKGWEVRGYDHTLRQIRKGDVMRFRLTANPVVRSKCRNENKSKIYARQTVEQQEQWLKDKSQKCGFFINDGDAMVVEREWFNFRKKEQYHTNGSVNLLGVTYEGVLTVTDEDLFRKTLCEGIGREKAYGMGLMTIAA